MIIEINLRVSGNLKIYKISLQTPCFKVGLCKGNKTRSFHANYRLIGSSENTFCRVFVITNGNIQ